MGCYDTVLVPCPKCGARREFQSKGGDCKMAIYNLEETPMDVLTDVNRHAPLRCESCGTLYKVGNGARPTEVKNNEES
jgi:uncharacterized Zn finger protein